MKQELLQFQRQEEEKRLREAEQWRREEEQRMVEFQRQTMRHQKEAEEQERRERDAEKERAREQREREQLLLQAKLLAEQQEREARIVQALEQQRIQEHLRQEQSQEERKKEEQKQHGALKEQGSKTQELSQQERFERENKSELPLDQLTREKSGDSTLGYLCENPAVRSSTSIKDDMIQAKAFVSWINYVLKGTEKSMTELSQFSDGELIIDLVEILCGAVMENKISPVQSTHQKMQNLSNALKFFAASKHVTLSSFSIPLIISKNSKILCDLAWELAYYSTIQPISYCGLTDRFALFFWLKQCVSTYHNVNIENFTSSWSDGLSLSALVHSVDPSLIDYYNLQEYAKSQNLRQALDAASQLSIPRLVDAADLLENPEEISLILYLAHFFHKFHQDTH